MNKLRIKLPTFLLLITVLGLAGFMTKAQTNNVENNQNNLEENRNLMRVLRLVDHLNKEADKQQATGFGKRAERVKNFFQRKSGISDDAKLKLNEIAGKFQKESENIDNHIKEIGKNQKDKLDKPLLSKLEELRASRNKLYDSARQSLYNNLSKDDLENVLKFLREHILAKMKRVDKSNSLDPNGKKNPFKKISYEKSLGGSLLNGYSFIDYDRVNNEVWSSSITEGDCPIWNGDYDQESECRGAYVSASMSDPETGVAADEME